MAWMVVRVRGSVHAKREIGATLKFLHLSRPNHATVLPEDPSFKGMLSRVQGYVTWGETDEATVGVLLAARGRTPEGRPLTEPPADGAPPPTPSAEVSALAKAVVADGLPRVAAVRPLFRLRAPKGGWRSTKKPFALGGALGYRGAAINELVRKML
jgi:large subunit ribosomal protein L30